MDYLPWIDCGGYLERKSIYGIITVFLYTEYKRGAGWLVLHANCVKKLYACIWVCTSLLLCIRLCYPRKSLLLPFAQYKPPLHTCHCYLQRHHHGCAMSTACWGQTQRLLLLGTLM